MTAVMALGHAGSSMTFSGALLGLFGGALIGASATLALLAHGRIAGVSGILGRVTQRDPGQPFRQAFLAGLVVTGALLAATWPSAYGASLRGIPALAVAGLLVGLGSTLANGCTSGHGVCGLSRGSPRSLIAVTTFMVTAAITVACAGAWS
jgi:uncharacterized membrane protein YedE/YeeE